jgi:hypothetical protein
MAFRRSLLIAGHRERALPPPEAGFTITKLLIRQSPFQCETGNLTGLAEPRKRWPLRKSD